MGTDPLHLRTWGTAGAPAVVLLHGQFMDGAAWEPLARRLSPRHHVVAPDLPGWGRSPLAEPHDAATVVAALEHALGDLGLRRASLVGASVGGHHALALALGGRITVDRLALLGGLAGLDAPARAAFGQYAAAVRAGVRLGAPYVELVTSPGWRGLHPDRARAIVERVDALPAAPLAADLELVAALPDLRPRLGTLEAPVLVRAGALDASTPVELTRELAARLPAARLELVDGCGHLLLLEDEAGTLDRVERFLAGDAEGRG